MSGSCEILSATLHGVEVQPVRVEVDLNQGIPGITIVGMPDTAVLESKSRVRAALVSSGFKMPRKHITINLSPSDVRKSGTGFDLPIALAILVATGQVRPDLFCNACVVGELSLDGSVSQVRGMVAFELYARCSGKKLICGSSLSPVKSLCEDVAVLSHLSDVHSLNGEAASQQSTGSSLIKNPHNAHSSQRANASAPEEDLQLDYIDVYGQSLVKRALMVAAAGGHSVLMIGPPGSGKSMLAQRFPGLLPTLGEQEMLDSALIHSVKGLTYDHLLNGVRPFRAPHHSISMVGLIGGGNPLLPGEISLAHNGVLFLDELPEFSPHVLQSLRQPIEDKVVHIVRAQGRFSFPACIQLIAAANPCPCGYFGDQEKHCTCSEQRIATYQSRIGGPLLDRFDMVIDVFRPQTKQVISAETDASTADLKLLAERGRSFSSDRREHSSALSSSLASREVSTATDHSSAQQFKDLSRKARRTLESLAQVQHMSARGICKVAKLARTLADISECFEVQEEHILEAAAYRKELSQ